MWVAVFVCYVSSAETCGLVGFVGFHTEETCLAYAEAVKSTLDDDTKAIFTCLQLPADL